MKYSLKLPEPVRVAIVVVFFIAVFGIVGGIDAGAI